MFATFNDIESALDHLKDISFPTVIKADGLAAGKGVLICQTITEGKKALEEIFVDNAFGSAGNKVVIEDFLEGEEASFIDDLGADTFAPGPVSMAATPNGIAGVPVDGWTQMVVYRKDLFETEGLAAPTSYSNVVEALEKLHNPPG